MRHQIDRSIQMRLAVFLSILMSTPVWAQGGNASSGAWEPPHIYFTYAVVVLVLVGSFLALAVIRAALSLSTWSLADALSEEVKVTDVVRDETSGAAAPREDKDGKPVMVTKMCASSSRLIALMGMMVILLMFLGFGAFVLYSFGMTGKMPSSINGVVRFLLAGLTLFAPYAVNKFASIFEGLSPKQEGSR